MRQGNPLSLPFVDRSPHRKLDVNLIASLRDRPARDLTGLYLAEGIRFLCSAVDSGAAVAGMVVCRALLSGPLPHTLINRARRAGCPVLELSAHQFKDLAMSPDPQGVILVLRQFIEPLPRELKARDLWIALESLRTPGNLGTLLRSGEAAGASGLMLFGPRAIRPDPFDPSVVRATMGSMFAHRFVSTQHREFRKWRAGKGLLVVGASPRATVDYRALSYRKPVVLMLGDEREGLSPGQEATCDALVRIPMHGRPDSLNLAMAGTLMLYEIRNQRNPVKAR